MSIFRQCAAFALACLALWSCPLVPASADTQTCNEFTGECTIVVVAGGGGGGGNAGGGNAGGVPSVPGCLALGGSPNPPPDADPDDWVEVLCMYGGSMTSIWIERSVVQVNPERLARTLIARMRLRPIGIGLTPKGADAMALVGLPVWLWVDGSSPTTWGPASISAGGVSMTAKVESLRWSLGDGRSVICGKGTVWRRGMGGKSSPTCGHTYSQQGTYTITATSHWVARWSGYGQSGTIPLDLSSSRQLTVGELHVIGVQR